ncbi:alpha/beta hydrolase [Streptomyces sp. NPDC026672]|uniref:alpha/beta fold hydrolase n=1 Tax=unclassified Streptomyces TaxID=2593676 RepID=UPI0033E25039
MLDGFTEGHAAVNGTRLHYVRGGTGRPLVLMEGWPRTWYALRHIMPELARHFTVIAVEYRGQGQSDKPVDGYDKKNMARDVYELIRQLGYDQVDLAGADIGGGVAYSFAAQFPEATRKLVMWEGTPFSPEFNLSVPLFTPPGTPNFFYYPMFFAENDMAVALLAGNGRRLIDLAISNLALRPENIGEEARQIYADAYNTPEAIRATMGIFQNFFQDTADNDSYAPLEAPVLAIAGGQNTDLMKRSFKGRARDTQYVTIPDSGHYIAEENPQALLAEILPFLTA